MELKGHDERIDAFRRGDRDLLRRIYQAYCDDVERMLRGGFTFTSDGTTMRFRGVSRPYRLQEMLQDAFFHAFRERVREGYDPSRSYRPYLMTVVRNHLIDRFRREKLERDLFVAADELAHEDESGREALDRMGANEGESGGEPSPEVESMRRELAKLLESFVDALDDRDRRVLEDYMLGELTQHEMADALGTNRNRVRTRIREIRRELLGHLKREGFVGGSNVEDVLQQIARLGLIGALP